MSLLRLGPLQKAAPFAPVIVRVIVGVIMVAHGWDKLQGGVDGFGGMLEGLGVPAPGMMAWVVTVIELVGGAALILGLLTRWAAVANSAVLLGAIFLVKLDVGLIAETGAGAELDLALLAGLIAVLVLGPGKPSLDHALNVEVAAPQLAGRR